MSIKERIVEQSAVMYLNDGLKNVRMDDIAAALGISKRTIYEAFGDKETLIMACVKYFFCKKEEAMCMRTSSARNIIEEMFLSMEEHDDMFFQKSFTLMSELKKFYPAIYDTLHEESFDNGTREVIERIRKGIDQGLFVSQLNVELSVSIFMDSMFAIMNRRGSIIYSADASVPKAMHYCVIFFVRGIATLKGIEIIDKYLQDKYK